MSYPSLYSVSEWQHLSNTANVDPELSRQIDSTLKQAYSTDTLVGLFDKLIELYAASKAHQNNPALKELNKNLIELFVHILNIDMTPANQKNKVDIVESLIRKRLTVRDYDRDYMPWKRPPLANQNDPYELILEGINQGKNPSEIKEALQNYNEENKNNLLTVDYMTSVTDGEILKKFFTNLEKEQYRIIPANGQLTKLTFLGEGATRKLTFQPFTTSRLTIKAKDLERNQDKDIEKTGIYVIDADGSLFVGPAIHYHRYNVFEKLKGKEGIYHTSYSVRPFIAGQIRADKFLTMMDPGSGHFKPNKKQYTSALKHLKDINLLNNETIVTSFTQGNFMEAKNIAYPFYLIDQCTEGNKFTDNNKLTTFLKDEHPRIWLQYNYSNVFRKWKEACPFGFSSKEKSAIDETLDIFSKFADVNRPDRTLNYLNQALAAIDHWHEYHAKAQKTSRYDDAVSKTELTLLNYKFDILLQQFLIDNQQRPDNQYLNSYISNKLSLEGLLDKLRPKQTQGFFDISTSGTSLIEGTDTGAILSKYLAVKYDAKGLKELMSNLELGLTNANALENDRTPLNTLANRI